MKKMVATNRRNWFVGAAYHAALILSLLYNMLAKIHTKHNPSA